MSPFSFSYLFSLIGLPKKDSLTVPPNVIRAAAEATAKREIESQKTQFRHLGIMADWSSESTYRTLGTRCFADALVLHLEREQIIPMKFVN
jgi:isoleucyl-tRNA synthetase